MSMMLDHDGQTLFFDEALLSEGWAPDVRVTIKNGRIIDIEHHAVLAPKDEHHQCAIPTMPNVHSHAFQRAMAGLTEHRGPTQDSFWTWRDIMYRFVEQITPEDMQAIAALAYIEMMESGFGRVGEFHYLHHDRDGAAYPDRGEMSAAIIEAAAETGIGLTLLPVLYSYAGFGGQEASSGQRRFVQDIDGFAALLERADSLAATLPDAVVGIAPHSLRAVSPAQLTLLAEMAGGRPVHIHIAEQEKEVNDCVAWSGQRPVEWLMNHVPVDDHWSLIHATHMTMAEVSNMAKCGAIAGICPITEANLGDGLFPFVPFLQAGGRYGIGSDSNVRIDSTEELRMMEYGQRLTRRERNILAQGANRSTGADMYLAAVAGGAASLGVVGGISVGQSADMVSLNVNNPSLIGRHGDAFLNGFIFSAGRDAVDCVWRFGRKIVQEGVHHARDRVTARYGAVLGKMIA